MAGDLVRVAWDDAALKLWIESPSSAPSRGMSLLASAAVMEMKRRCPVSPASRPATARWPARPSGTLRSSIQAFRQSDGSYLIGPTDTTADGQSLGRLVNDGTRPHVIAAHGPWPLHNPVTGQYFGPRVAHPGTRPQPFITQAAETLASKRIRIG